MFLREFYSLQEKPGCNMTEEGRVCPEHGLMECPGYKMIETSAQEKLHQRHQEIRKKSGLPNPNYYKELRATFDLPDEERQAAVAAIKKKYNVNESGPFSYGAKKPKKGSVADLAAKKRQEQEKGRRPVEPKDHMVGVARVKKDVAEGTKGALAGGIAGGMVGGIPGAVIGGLGGYALGGTNPEHLPDVDDNRYAVFIDGRLAARNGKSLEDNPYEEPEEMDVWQDGWESIFKEGVAEGSAADPFRDVLMALRQDSGNYIDTKGQAGGRNFALDVNQRLAQLQRTDNPRAKVIANTVTAMIGDAQKGAAATKGLSYGTLANTLMQLTQQELQRANQQGVAEGLRDPKDNPCWKGYKPVGTKKKAGKTVPNCVPTNEDIEKYVEELERAGYEVLEEKTRLDPKCWKGYRKAGTKMKGGVRVNNCVPIKKKVDEQIPEIQPPETPSNSLKKGIDVLNNLYIAKKMLSGGPEALANQEIINFLQGSSGDPTSKNLSIINRMTNKDK